MIDVPLRPKQPGDKEYRCTLPDLYPKPHDGFKDRSLRQGFFIDAQDEEDARQQMRERFPSAKNIDVDLWKPKTGAKA